MTIKEFLFGNSKKYGTLSYRVSHFLKYKLPFSKGWNKLHNPLYHWWKVRKDFKRPRAHFIASKNPIWFYGFPIRSDYLNRVIDIRFKALGWKDKYNSPRHEWDPYISILLFRKYHLLWTFNWTDPLDYSSSSMATWEAILDMLYYGKSLEEVKSMHVWVRVSSGKRSTIIPNLRKRS